MISCVNIVQIVMCILRLYVDLWRLILSMILLVRNFVSPPARVLCLSLPVPVLLSIYLPLVVSPYTFTEKPVGNNINLVFSRLVYSQSEWNYCQKWPPTVVPRIRCSENMQQIYRGTSMPNCDFNKVALQHLF